jgi:hypothetical protein
MKLHREEYMSNKTYGKTELSLFGGFVLIVVICSVITIANVYGRTGGNMKKWKHIYIANPLPGESWGAAGPALADFDGDGDLDTMVSRRSTETAYWYERIDDENWVEHKVGSTPELKPALGMTAVDIDHDGKMDVATNKVWFRNPGNLDEKPDTPWEMHKYEGGGHDVLPGDIDGDGWDDVVADIGAAWYPTPGMEKVETGGEGEYHGGPSPRGVGDLDGDGDNDIVQPGRWLENPGNGRGEWKKHKWDHEPVPNASYGTSTRSWVVDVNNDGKNDIVYSDCDTSDSHVYWVENKGKGDDWERHKLTDPPTAPGSAPGTGSFHSLGVADFDNDGDLDIFAGEQEDPDTYMTSSGKLPMKRPGMIERGVIWENVGTRENPEFEPVVFQIDNPGFHEAQIGDVDGDGDVDIVAKIWNKDSPAYTLNYWRNDND